MTSITVRRATIDDLDAVAALFDLYRQFYKKPADPKVARAFVEARLMAGESVIFVAACEGDGPVGFVQLYPGFSSLGMARTWIVNDLYIAETHRRLKIATQLMEAAHVFARSTGAASLSLETQIENKKAQTLYEKFGYEIERGFLIYSLALT